VGHRLGQHGARGLGAQLADGDHHDRRQTAGWLEARETRPPRCLLYTSDAADELDGGDLGGRRRDE
jgi:hypothetical protein